MARPKRKTSMGWPISIKDPALLEYWNEAIVFSRYNCKLGRVDFGRSWNFDRDVDLEDREVANERARLVHVSRCWNRFPNCLWQWITSQCKQHVLHHFFYIFVKINICWIWIGRRKWDQPKCQFLGLEIDRVIPITLFSFLILINNNNGSGGGGSDGATPTSDSDHHQRYPLFCFAFSASTCHQHQHHLVLTFPQQLFRFSFFLVGLVTCFKTFNLQEYYVFLVSCLKNCEKEK